MNVAGHGNWPASLRLVLRATAGATRLVEKWHEGPLRVQKPLYPEGRDLCHILVLHPPSGLAGGDSLALDIALEPATRALFTTPGAGKWYRSAGSWAEQEVTLKVGAGATAEWLPQESIVFDRARARMRTRVELEDGARYLGLETIGFGRRASGEAFAEGELRLATDIRLAGQPLWHERGAIAGGSSLMHSPIGLAGFTVCSTILAAGVEVTADTLTRCRAACPREPGAQVGVTVMPRLLVGRYLGHSTESARHWFIEMWRSLRPIIIGREACVPRIWST